MDSNSKNEKSNNIHDSFLFYCKWWEILEDLSMEQRGKIIGYIVNYAQTGKAPSGADSIESLAFNFIKADLDRNFSKYDSILEKRRAAGKLGGESKAKRSNKENKNKQMLANVANASFAKHNDNVNDNDYVSHNERIPPLPPLGDLGEVDLFLFLQKEAMAKYKYKILDSQYFNLHGMIEWFSSPTFNMASNEIIEIVRKWGYGRIGTTIWREGIRIEKDQTIKSRKAVLKSIEPNDADLCLIQ